MCLGYDLLSTGSRTSDQLCKAFRLATLSLRFLSCHQRPVNKAQKTVSSWPLTSGGYGKSSMGKQLANLQYHARWQAPELGRRRQEDDGSSLRKHSVA